MGMLLEKLVLPASNTTYDKCLPYLIFVPRDDCHFVPVVHYIYDQSLPTLFIAHGNSSDLGSYDVQLMASKYQANICMFDYSGYGLHTNKSVSEEDCVKDAKSVYKYLEQNGIHDIVLYGYSIGSYVMIRLAHYLSKYNKCHKLVLVSAFKSIMHAGIFMSLPGDVFKSIDYAPCIQCFTLALHGNLDSFTDFNGGKELATYFPNLYKFKPICGYGHEKMMQSEEQYEEVKKFIYL